MRGGSWGVSIPNDLPYRVSASHLVKMGASMSAIVVVIQVALIIATMLTTEIKAPISVCSRSSDDLERKGKEKRKHLEDGFL